MRSMFTRRHYEFIASAISGINCPLEARQQIAACFAARFENESALFNRAKFMAACGATFSAADLERGRTVPALKSGVGGEYDGSEDRAGDVKGGEF